MGALESQTQHRALSTAYIYQKSNVKVECCVLSLKMSLLLICHRAVNHKQDNHCDGLDLAGTCGHFWLFHRRVDFEVNLFVAYLSDFIGDQCLFFLS